VRDEPSLVRRAVLVLQDGSAHTLDLAREVLGLSGNAGAASAAVFALLGTDPRFQVDRGGWWTLVGEAPVAEEELSALSYAVVDVETTGVSPDRGHRITEIAVVEVRDGVISEDFQTLVNPGRSIPSQISALTGITNEMVSGAPFFDEVAEDLFEWLEGRVFVAHNASFDWRFIHHQMTGTLGYAPQSPRLCTVQMARRLAPQLARRNLDSIAAHFGVPIHIRHRAYGDALATARVLLRLLDEAEAQGFRDLSSLQLLLCRKSRSR